MKTINAPILSVKTKNTVTGAPIVVEKTIKGEKKNVEQAIVTCKYGEFWLPASIVEENHNEIVLKFEAAGEEFIATRDSKRTKGEVMGKDCPEGKEDEPLYFKGEAVPREKDYYEAQVTQVRKTEVLGFEEKAKILLALGVNPGSLM